MAYADPYDPRARSARRKHYHNNKQAYLDRAQESKRELRKFLEDLKANTSCTDCGERYPHYVMEFDHLEGQVKLNNVSSLVGWGRKRLQAEIAKCDIVCANCHAARTYFRRLASRAANPTDRDLGSNPS